jgi:hypothetical protein
VCVRCVCVYVCVLSAVCVLSVCVCAHFVVEVCLLVYHTNSTNKPRASITMGVSTTRSTLLCQLITFLGIIAATVSSAPTSASFSSVYVDFGSNLGSLVPTRITTLLSSIPGITVQPYSSYNSSGSVNSLVLAFGNTTLANQYVDISKLSAEGFVIKSVELGASNSGNILVASNGAPLATTRNGKSFSYALDVDSVHYGAVMGSYQLLEQLGFAFIHPLETFVPDSVRLPEDGIDISQSPRWPVRTWHVHTMHPLEFHEVLNGFDIPMFGCPSPATTYCESFDSMLPNVSGLFEWAIANGQNRVESLLLGNKKWEMRDESMAMGAQRQQRLKQINDLAHQFGMLMGADIPIAFLQQHAWAMVRCVWFRLLLSHFVCVFTQVVCSVHDDVDKQISDMNTRIDWAFNAGFDFISTESGLSEFTKPSCDLMLTLFNAFSTRSTFIAPSDTFWRYYCSCHLFVYVSCQCVAS